MIIYADIILIENIIMNYIILLATGIICKVSIKHLRLLISSFIGGVYVVALYIFTFTIYTHICIKILLSIGMVYIAFRANKFYGMFKQLVIFYLTSFCFGGAAYSLLYGISSNVITNVNEILVGTYPMKIAILGGILGFFMITVSFKMIKSKLTKKDMIYHVKIGYQNKLITVKVLLDTGNLLVEPITKVPVLIVEAEELKSILPYAILKNVNSSENWMEMEEEIKTRCSFLPFSSIGKKNGMILGFRPDYVAIETPENTQIIKKVILGIYPHKLDVNHAYTGLMGLNLLNTKEVSYEYHSTIKN